MNKHRAFVVAASLALFGHLAPTAVAEHCHPRVSFVSGSICPGKSFTLRVDWEADCSGVVRYSLAKGPTVIGGLNLPLGTPNFFLFAGPGTGTFDVPAQLALHAEEVYFAAIAFAPFPIVEPPAVSERLTVGACR